LENAVDLLENITGPGHVCFHTGLIGLFVIIPVVDNYALRVIEVFCCGKQILLCVRIRTLLITGMLSPGVNPNAVDKHINNWHACKETIHTMHIILGG
jgi:hypothetical protein